ncbi:Tryptophan 5-hydroxylase 1 [Tetrabaena socialis]|uniref:phenylalanine 4-monooxygenase n=1 Tax=Tetrabaena socialis TaxID=47790 RepID=A0A2J8AD84_9CHLO|nr:Tryptophan 5-hydroxylase 1 [Tetrabaena socialis]|eukprot:PNH10478.1 Tryptophan 5-hydroxylase 1 [Tetrabaena socialis]
MCPLRTPLQRQQLTAPRTRIAASGASASQSSASTAAPAAPIRSIHDVDNSQILGFGADLADDHPGYHDEAYKRRRSALAEAAKRHVVGTPIPDVSYGPEEVATWDAVLAELSELLPRHACKEYLRCLPLFNFRPGKVPQLSEINGVLAGTTGWTVRPVAGLLHPRHFLAGLAFKHFHSTQYMRHPSKPSYTPEPDIVHELIGHVPLLADPSYSRLIQAIGRASLGADDKAIWHLTKVYWFTIEFGVVRERGDIKAFGAGILSSYGELAHMASGAAALEPLDPFRPQPRMSYKDGFQKRYFLLDSFEGGAELLQRYAENLALPESLRGDTSVA